MRVASVHASRAGRPRSRRLGTPVRVLAVSAVALLVALGATACEPPRPPAKDRVIIFVHGWSALGAGNDCNGNFGSLKTALRNDGFTGAMVTVGFYDSDRNCELFENPGTGRITAQSFVAALLDLVSPLRIGS